MPHDPLLPDGVVNSLADVRPVVRRVVRAGADWETLAVNDLDDEVYATPAIAGGRIFIRTRSALYCFGPATVATTK